MARMHSRKKGISGSKRPAKTTAPLWQRYKPEEIELLVAKLAKESNAAKVGIILRDTYGIPSVKIATGKSISQILEKKKLLPDIPDDLYALIKKALLIRKHLETGKNDQTANRGLTLTESKIRRLSKYYIGTGRLPGDWIYDPEKMKLIVN